MLCQQRSSIRWALQRAAISFSALNFEKSGNSHKSSDLFRKMATSRASSEVKLGNASKDLECVQSRFSDKPQQVRCVRADVLPSWAASATVRATRESEPGNAPGGRRGREDTQQNRRGRSKGRSRLWAEGTSLAPTRQIRGNYGCCEHTDSWLPTTHTLALRTDCNRRASVRIPSRCPSLAL